MAVALRNHHLQYCQDFLKLKKPQKEYKHVINHWNKQAGKKRRALEFTQIDAQWSHALM